MVRLTYGVWAKVAQWGDGLVWRIQDAGILVWSIGGDGCARTVGWALEPPGGAGFI